MTGMNSLTPSTTHPPLFLRVHVCRAHSITPRRFEAGIQGRFLLGDYFSLADVHAAPVMWRIMTEAHTLGVSKEKYPKMYKWMEAVNERPSFKATVVSSWWWWW